MTKSATPHYGVIFYIESADQLQKAAEKNGKADWTMDLELKDNKGEIVSLVNGIWQLRKIPKGSSPRL